MKKLRLIIPALIGMGCFIPFLTACSDDSPTEESLNSQPLVRSITRPISISSDDKQILSFSYDNFGRLSNIYIGEGIEYSISYEPLSILISENASSILLSDILTNNEGFITEATFYSDGCLPFSYRFEYDSANRILSMKSDGINNFSCEWSNGDMIKFHSHAGNETLAYSDTPNTEGSVSLYWGSMAPLWLTGMFGVVPAHFPDTMSQNYRDYGLSYTLNPNHTIDTEEIRYNDKILTLDYHYDDLTRGSRLPSTWSLQSDIFGTGMFNLFCPGNSFAVD